MQLRHDVVYGIGDGKLGQRKSPFYPGRWEWISYSLETGAIIGIVIATLTACVALALGGYSIYKFIMLFLFPGAHDDDDDSDSDSD